MILTIDFYNFLLYFSAFSKFSTLNVYFKIKSILTVLLIKVLVFKMNQTSVILKTHVYRIVHSPIMYDKESSCDREAWLIQ